MSRIVRTAAGDQAEETRRLLERARHIKQTCLAGAYRFGLANELRHVVRQARAAWHLHLEEES